ncbi:hypothetical protein [Streptomyces sp. NPDC058297]|uniref:hypothetical protein n=1 Tax=Streptomyces sp. NPDC058297 TaxID=3346433 RepID=UPI0036E23B00
MLPPQAASWAVLKDALSNMAAEVERMAAVPAVVDDLTLAFERSQWRAGRGSEFIADVAQVNARIGDILAGARQELLGAHPLGPRRREQMELGIARDTAALERGVQFRTLYLDAVRDDPVTCEWASTMAGRGAHFRTLADPFERVIVVDRKVAVIANYVMEDAPPHAAWIITDRAMVAFCAHAFEQEWRRGRVWHGERRVRGGISPDVAPAGERRLSEAQRAVLRALSEGETLEGAARRLKVSKRTLQRDLEAIRAAWNLPNAPIAQLTFCWATSPERTLEQAA